MASPDRFVGIDLGTTMSAIAHLDAAGNVTTLPNSDGEPLTPSAIYIDGEHVVVGKSAKQTAAHLPDKVAVYVKREMGKPLYSRVVDGRQFRPETLSAIIIRKMKLDAERKIGLISRAVITVPAYFDDARRKATQDAGRIAGLESVTILNEPTSAALAYCLEGHLGKRGGVLPSLPGGKLTALVYDLGGGTFDVTVIRMEAKHVQTLATGGAVKLGGKDWDDRLANCVVDEFQKQHGLVIPPDRRHGIGNQAETTKKLLSQIPFAEVECYFQDRAVRLPITRAKFDEITRDLLAQTEAVTKEVLREVRLPEKSGEATWNDIDRVLLVGGSTRMPMVSAMLRRVTGKEPDNSLDPDQVVAKGAAIHAAILATHEPHQQIQLSDEVQASINAMQVDDVNSHSLGVEVIDPKTNQPVNAILIPRNQKLPVAYSRIFPTRDAGRTMVNVRVLEGEAPDPSANIELGKCVVRLPPNLPAKSPVQIRLSYGTDGRVSAMALDMTGGGFAQTNIERRSGMTDEEVQRERDIVSRMNIQ